MRETLKINLHGLLLQTEFMNGISLHNLNFIPVLAR
jgi:hypothetical protein